MEEIERNRRPEDPSRTQVLYGSEHAVAKGVEFMKNVKKRMDIYFDSQAPSIVIEIDAYRNGYVDIRKRGGKIRAFTEINKDNIHYCKELIKIVDELRHLEGIKGGLAVSETEFMSTTLLQVAMPLTEVIYSNIPEIVQQGQYIFETLWNKAIPAELRIKEIEEGIPPEFAEVITDAYKSVGIIIEFANSVNREASILLSSSKTITKWHQLGLWEPLINAAKYRGAKIKIICPISEENSKLIEQLQQDGSGKIQIINGQEMQSSVFIIDNREFFRIESDDNSIDIGNSSGPVNIMVHSNSRKGVEIYKSFFNALWIQSELYEKIKSQETAEKEFINIAAHELRTPVQVILGFAEVLVNRIHAEPDHTYMQSILRNARRLQTLTEQILDVTKIESQLLKLDLEDFDICEKIRSIMKDVGDSEAAKKNISLEFESEDGDTLIQKLEPLIVQADKTRIFEVLSNLIRNAIKFTESGGRITVGIKVSECHVIVSVRDTGKGIDSNMLPKLFTKFSTKSDSGTGLGLYIAKNIVEAHGGRIWAENNRNGKGAIFAFSLPLKC
jgi:signal transduction histidine kinase